VKRAVRLVFWGVLLAVLGGCGNGSTTRGDPVVVAAYDLTDDDTLGWHDGVKQPLGAYQNGRSIHQITKSTDGGEGSGDPDVLLWVDERAGTHAVIRHATGQAVSPVARANPGGTVTFGPDGTIWYLTGGRAHLMPPALFASVAPYDPHHFETKRAPIVTEEWATSFDLVADGRDVFLLWRDGPSRARGTTVRFRRYVAAGDFEASEVERALGVAAGPEGNPIGIEQAWLRFDPRYRMLLATWQWLDASKAGRDAAVPRFGANPFLYSDDAGATWRSVDGHPRTAPLEYADHDDVLVPYDHFTKDEWTTWQSWDLGVAPGGTFWMVMPVGAQRAGRYDALAMFLFDGTAWQRRDLVSALPAGRKSHACATTRDALVLVYADPERPNVLQARASREDGRTWSPPAPVDVLPESRVISWISFAQPSTSYEDDAARFFVLHHPRGDPEGAFHGSVRWIKVALQ